MLPEHIKLALEEIATLTDGWLDGSGKAIDKKAIQMVSDWFKKYPDIIPKEYWKDMVPFPTFEGQIEIEGDIKNSRKITWTLHFDSKNEELTFNSVQLDSIKHSINLDFDINGHYMDDIFNIKIQDYLLFVQLLTH
jgi:hypothetical protein